MSATSTLFHFLGALRRALVRVILFGLLFLIIGIALIEGLAFIVGRSSTGAYTPSLITHITAAITGIVLGYAAVLTVIAVEAIHAFIDAIRDVEKGVTSDVKGVASDVGGGVKIMDRVVQYIEGKI